MSDTPRTDVTETFCYGHIDQKWTPAHFARKLERELGAVTAERNASQQEVARLRDALMRVSNATVMKSRDSGMCVGAEVKDIASDALSSTPAPTRTDTERRFPMQYGPSIPWSFAELLYVGYSACYGDKQTLEGLAQRGGFGWSEIEHFWGSKTFREAIDAEIERTKGAE